MNWKVYWIDCEVCGFHHSSIDEYGELFDCWNHYINKNDKLKKLISTLKKLLP